MSKQRVTLWGLLAAFCLVAGLGCGAESEPSPRQPEQLPVGELSAAVTSWVQVPIPNANLSLQSLDTGYPVGSVTLGGVPFSIPSGNNTWHSDTASNSAAGTVSLTIPVNIANATEVHTLMNTYWGQTGGPYTQLEFWGSAGAYYSLSLFGNDHIRDYLNNVWTNSINGTTTINVVNLSSVQRRLDKQRIVLPAAFASQTLTQIRITDSGSPNFHRAFISGLTVGVGTSTNPPTCTAAWSTVAIPSANFSLQSLNAGYPVGNVTLGGVPFSIPSGNNSWHSHTASNSAAGTVSLTIPVNLANVTEVHTLMNTYWGQTGGPYTRLEFWGSAGAYHSLSLFGNDHIRDFLNNAWTNTINGTTTINVVNLSSVQRRLDKQRIVLPAAFASQTLTQIRITDSGSPNFHRAFISGLTVLNCP